MKNHKLVYQQR